MIISKTPLRISIGGGGTDLPEFYEKMGGFFVSAAITKYIYVVVHKPFDDTITLKYSEIEKINNIDYIKHGIIREVLRAVGHEGGIEIVSFADLPSRSGLGSSGSFTVGLRSIFMSRCYKDNTKLAEAAYDIERNKLGYSIGKQDPYIAAYGGVTAFEIDTSGKVVANRLHPCADLSKNLLLFYTGQQRDANTILVEQAKSMSKASSYSNMMKIKGIGYRISEAISTNNIHKVGLLFDEHWKHKKKVSDKMTSPRFDKIYDEAKKHGALGGKIVGAGMSGFFLFYVEKNHNKFVLEMEKAGLKYIDFGFDMKGNTIL